MMKSDPLQFWKVYESVNSTEKHFSVKRKSEICRYCNRTTKEVTFNQDTHLLPELLGTNNILTYDECDSCNSLFSEFESNLSIYFRPFITLIGTKGKRKVPAFQSRTVNKDENTRTTLEHIYGNKKHLKIQNSKDVIRDDTNGKAEIIFRRPPFTPIKIYKAFLKIGLGLLPHHLDEYNKQSFAWLTNRIDKINFISNA